VVYQGKLLGIAFSFFWFPCQDGQVDLSDLVFRHFQHSIREVPSLSKLGTTQAVRKLEASKV
jgi:hypothetical protein